MKPKEVFIIAFDLDTKERMAGIGQYTYAMTLVKGGKICISTIYPIEKFFELNPELKEAIKKIRQENGDTLEKKEES